MSTNSASGIGSSGFGYSAKTRVAAARRRRPRRSASEVDALARQFLEMAAHQLVERDDERGDVVDLELSREPRADPRRPREPRVAELIRMGGLCGRNRPKSPAGRVRALGRG